MVNIFFQASALMHIIVTIVVYLTKNKQKTIDNHVYGSLIIFEVITLIADIFSQVAAIYIKNDILNCINGKIFLCGLTSWLIIFTFYLHIITHPKNTERVLMETNEHSKMFLTSMRKMMLFNLIVIIIILVLPLHTSTSKNSFTISGPSEIFSYIMGGSCILAWMGLLFKKRKERKNERVKFLLFSIVIAIFALVLQYVKPDFSLLSSLGAFFTTLAYFMLENPDLHYIEELNIATRQAESANHAKSDFLSSMSHEIRTPLNAIVGFSQALAKEDISGGAKDEVKEILNASTNLLETVNGILDISKIEANKIELLQVDYSTKKLINEIINISNSRLGSKTIDFKIEIDDELPPVLYGDSIRIKQIIVNLLTNAIKYTKDGYVRFSIDSQTYKDKCLLTIIVEDTGVGMTKEDIEMLFVKFQRFEMDKNINIAGTGLGMAITKGLVELMNGEISVDSEYGKGSTFTIVIEQDVSSKQLEEVATEEELQKIEPFNATGQRVLVVDDNQINLKVAEKLLSEYQLSIDLVDSGRECINKIISGEKYDIILLDIMMPKMKGPEVLKNLKAQVGFNTPVVALTADVISGMEEKYTAQGFDDCLPKPIVEEELFYLLKKYLKEVTEEGLLEHNYTEIETPVVVASPVVKEVVAPVELEELELPKLSDLPALKEELELPTIVNEPAEKEAINIINELPNLNDDRVELIEQIKQNKENPVEYEKLVVQVKDIAEKENLKELAAMAYEHELAARASYQEFITENYDKFVNEIINNIEIIKNNINKE